MNIIDDVNKQLYLMEIDKGYVNIVILFLFGLFLIYKGLTSISNNGNQLKKMLIDENRNLHTNRLVNF